MAHPKILVVSAAFSSRHPARSSVRDNSSGCALLRPPLSAAVTTHQFGALIRSDVPRQTQSCAKRRPRHRCKGSGPSAAPSPSRGRLPDAGRKCVRLSTRVQGIPRFAPAFSRTRLNHSVACHPAIKAHPNESAEASATAVHRPLRFRPPHHRCGRTPIAQNVARNLVGRCCLTIRPDNRSASARNGHCGLRRWWYREHRRTRCRRKECNAHLSLQSSWR